MALGTVFKGHFNCNELVPSERGLKAIAAAAIMGISRLPKIASRIPVAMATPVACKQRRETEYCYC